MIAPQIEEDKAVEHNNPMPPPTTTHNSISHHITQHHCCNFQHIVQLQDGTTRSVLCSNLKMAPHPGALRLRNQLINAKPCHPGTAVPPSTGAGGSMGNGCGAALLNSGHNSSSATASTTESVLNKMYSGPERII